ncbi:MAG: winged helix-turn-helix domain-containing protein, partial [Acidobacteriota bacterium]|nr:winged helix-turn-helix domain-containing protein [Acidobacteriota bacterium]
AGFASQAEVQNYIFEQFGVRLARANVSKLLQRLEVTAKVPRPRNLRTSEEEQQVYKKTMRGS